MERWGVKLEDTQLASGELFLGIWDAPTQPWNPTSEFRGEITKELPAHKIPNHFHIAANRLLSALSVVMIISMMLF